MFNYRFEIGLVETKNRNLNHCEERAKASKQYDLVKKARERLKS